METYLLLRPRQRRALLLGIISAVFTAGGIAMVAGGKLLGWLVAGFFGLCLLVAIVQTLPGSAYLELTPAGFTMCSLYRRGTIAWADVSGFGVTTVGAQTMVGFNFAESYGRAAQGRALASALAGIEGALPDTYGMQAQALAELMNRWRESYGTPNRAERS